MYVYMYTGSGDLRASTFSQAYLGAHKQKLILNSLGTGVANTSCSFVADAVLLYRLPSSEPFAKVFRQVYACCLYDVTFALVRL